MVRVTTFMCLRKTKRNLLLDSEAVSLKATTLQSELRKLIFRNTYRAINNFNKILTAINILNSIEM